MCLRLPPSRAQLSAGSGIEGARVRRESIRLEFKRDFSRSADSDVNIFGYHFLTTPRGILPQPRKLHLKILIVENGHTNVESDALGPP
jgi:hypothetical protein